MKLPIHLNIEGDTVWTTYREERDAAKGSVEALRAFVERWKEIYPFRVDQVVINEQVLEVVKSEKPGRQDFVALNIILPDVICYAMQKAKEFVVPLNTAFIQSNGGLGAFEGDCDEHPDPASDSRSADQGAGVVREDPAADAG